MAEVRLTCLQNLSVMVAAVPDCLRQIPAQVWDGESERWNWPMTYESMTAVQDWASVKVGILRFRRCEAPQNMNKLSQWT